MTGEVYFLKMAAVVNVDTRSCTLAETEKEADLMLTRALRGTPPGRVEQMGFRIASVMVTVHVLPDSCFTPPGAEQGALFN